MYFVVIFTWRENSKGTSEKESILELSRVQAISERLRVVKDDATSKQVYFLTDQSHSYVVLAHQIRRERPPTAQPCILHDDKYFELI